MPPLLEVRQLNIEFSALHAGRPGAAVPTQTLRAVRDLSFSIDSGEVLGLVGESGSGKSITSLAIMRLLPGQARVSGDILFAENGAAAVRVNRLWPPRRVVKLSPPLAAWRGSLPEDWPHPFAAARQKRAT